MRILLIVIIVLLAHPCLAEVKRKVDDKGVTFTSRTGSDITVAGKTEDSGRIAQTLYYRGYFIATFIGWTKDAQTAAKDGKLFQRKLSENYMKEGEKSLRLHYFFLRRSGGVETFHLAKDGEVIDAYFVSEINELTPMTDEEFAKFREQRAASRE